MKRDFVFKNEGRLSVLQIIGFWLMSFGVVVIVISSFMTPGPTIPSVIAVSFFVTMLGFAFAFPSLLQGNDGLSTMRIVVFMMTNVICMLLLKIGWANGIISLKQIGLDQYWVGVIAFVFGAKATQSFFESRMAVPTETPKIGMAAVAYTNADVAKLAVAQNEQYLRVKFPNILSVSDAVNDLSQPESHVIALYLKDNNMVGIPDKLEVKMPDEKIQIISTEIIKNVGQAIIHISQKSDNISDINSPTYLGSICCLVKSTTNPDLVGALTSGHIYTNGSFNNFGGILNFSQQSNCLIDNQKSGNWYLQIMNNQQDLAISKLDPLPNTDANYQSFKNGYYHITDDDVKPQTPNVTIISKNNKVRDAYLIDYNVAFSVNYNNRSNYVSNIILIGSSNSRDQSKTLSVGGDSGSCVYHKNSGKLIGMLLGGNDKFTFVLPVEETLNHYNLKPL